MKRALPRLNVAAVWDAPVERSRFEVAWLEVANEIVPGIGPEVLAHDDGGAIVLAYLDPDELSGLEVRAARRPRRSDHGGGASGTGSGRCTRPRRRAR